MPIFSIENTANATRETVDLHTHHKLLKLQMRTRWRRALSRMCFFIPASSASLCGRSCRQLLPFSRTFSIVMDACCRPCLWRHSHTLCSCRWRICFRVARLTSRYLARVCAAVRERRKFKISSCWSAMRSRRRLWPTASGSGSGSRTAGGAAATRCSPGTTHAPRPAYLESTYIEGTYQRLWPARHSFRSVARATMTKTRHSVLLFGGI